MPCRGFFSAVVCSFIFIIGGCLAETAHASHTSSVASLESLLEAKIPATSEKATKDYEAARSIFKSAEGHRSEGVGLYSKGFDMRRTALLKARVLVHSLAQAGLGAESRAAVRDLHTITSLARRIARIATNPNPPPNSKQLLSYLSEAAVKARDRFHAYNHELDDSMLALPQVHFTQMLFHAEMLCQRGKIYKALADSEDASATLLKEKARELALQVKRAQHRIEMLSEKPSAQSPSPGAKKIISLEKHEAARDSIVINYLLHKDEKTMLTASSHDTSSNVAGSLMSDLKKQDAQEARDERRHLDVDVDYGKAPKNHFTLADSLVRFSHRLAESDTTASDGQTAGSVQARSPIPLGTDGGNSAALEIARDTSPDDQVDLAAGQAPGDDSN